ncbi:hypothetical protein MAR_033289 [Mya arenaria]|uniref:Uncharacterized protein n=1 Tax=Mya arenaria TaxID=6604 RepID=A0ABY7GBM3_MYAAR|nr:hypothetical protein MAR_033289 [Mya arenaria]
MFSISICSCLTSSSGSIVQSHNSQFTECPDCITILTRRLNSPADMIVSTISAETGCRATIGRADWFSISTCSCLTSSSGSIVQCHNSQFTECPDCITILTRRLNSPADMIVSTIAIQLRRAVEQPSEERTGSPSPPAAVSRPLQALLYRRLTHSSHNVPTVSQYYRDLRRAVEQPSEERTGSPSPTAAVSRPHQLRRAVEQPSEERTGSPSPPAAVSRSLQALLYSALTYSSQNVPTENKSIIPESTKLCPHTTTTTTNTNTNTNNNNKHTW